MSTVDLHKIDWLSYFQKTKGGGTRITMQKALDLFVKDRKTTPHCFDLGCGAGNDALVLLQNGWTVTGIDSDKDFPTFISYLFKDYPTQFTIQNCKFEAIEWQTIDLVNAGYCLPFCEGKYFDFVWKNIESNLVKGGRFSGQFFGEKDEWKSLVLKSKNEIELLFKNFEIEYFDEKEQQKLTASNEMKHWHIFNIVARKK